ncbi:hypothetical protein EI94DRAFT_1777112 [Lactarius quietus]|nr:hypothetical protein EI94DRAFT_1777112 [Lactarius quietus]
MEHEIIRIPSVGQPGREQLRHQCYGVRIDVFHREQGFPLDTEIDKLDETAEHFLLRLLPSLRPIGTIRASRTTSTVPHYKLSRLAVLKNYRNSTSGDQFDEDGAPHQKMALHLPISR